MTIPNVATTSTFEDWRNISNQMAQEIGDLDNLQTDAKTDLVSAVNSVGNPGVVANGGLAKVGGDFKVNFDDDTLNVNTATGKLQIKNDGVHKAQLNADVAGPGLKQNQDESLSPRTDNSTLQVNTNNLLEVKDKGVTGGKLADNLTLNPNKADSDFVIHGSGENNTFYFDAGNKRIGMKTATPAVSVDLGNCTDAIQLPVGTTAQRPTIASGQLRYNSDTDSFEGATSAGWSRFGGISGIQVKGEEVPTSFFLTDETYQTGVWQTRKLDKVSSNPSGMAITLESNQLTLPAGTYFFSILTDMCGGSNDFETIVRIRTLTSEQTFTSPREKQDGDDGAGITITYTGLMVLSVSEAIVIEQYNSGSLKAYANPVVLTLLKIS